MKLLVDDLYNSAGTRPRSSASRVVLTIACIAGAYHASLWTLLVRSDAESARAVALLALAAAVAYAPHEQRTTVTIQDRQVDWIVAISFLAMVVSLNAAVDVHSDTYWTHRVDLFSLPFFVVGVVALLFGVRMVGQQRRAIMLLFLAWIADRASAPVGGAFDVFGWTAATLLMLSGLRRFRVGRRVAVARERERFGAEVVIADIRRAVCCIAVAAAVMGWFNSGLTGTHAESAAALNAVVRQAGDR